MTKDEALKLALEALDTSMYPQRKQIDAIAAIQAALAQPEPVKFKCTVVDDHHPQGIPLEQWGDPPAAQRKPLTDEQRMCSERTAAYADAYATAAYADAAAAYATADAYADADADAYKEGCKVGRAEAFEQIAEKVKEMPWENDTKDSFLIWLKEQR
jgi:flagellar biosynthesis/type III secretory pathway protein FliH